MSATRLALAAACILAWFGAHATAQPRLDDAHRKLADETARRAIDYLRHRQDTDTGGWGINPRGPQLPAMTALVINGMRLNGVADDDEAVRRGVEYLLSYQQPDGGIYDMILPSYNTACALSALAGIDDPRVREAVARAQRFLVGLQWSEDAAEHAGVARVGPDHPFYGGIGYGRHGRPDLSNLGMALQGLVDSGLDRESPAFRRAVVFLSRVQMLEGVNDMAYAKGSTQGGFIYATGTDADNPDIGQSMAGEIEETLTDGTTVSRLRAYGSMTYAGFKSYIYAGLPRDDERVQAALGWLSRTYTLDENPGLGPDGVYYYYVVMARALDAWGEPAFTVARPDDEAESRPWAEDLVARLASLQRDDGSFESLAARWMESDHDLITAYSLIALGAARAGDVD